jgi:Ciliary BBSome complex subunit 2, middle region
MPNFWRALRCTGGPRDVTFPFVRTIAAVGKYASATWEPGHPLCALAHVRSRPGHLGKGKDILDARMQGKLIESIKEADEVTSLCSIGQGCFGYTLSNCTVGAYAGTERAWRVKSKYKVHSVCAHDFHGQGELQLLSGWGNGKV